MSFRSRISVLLLLFISVPGIVTVCKACLTKDYMSLLCLVYLPIVIVLLLGIRYVIDGDKLYVKDFPFMRGKEYDLKKLVSVSPTRSILSAPAASLLRIKLDFGCGDALIISPAAQNIFIDEILRANPNVKVNL